MPSKFKSNFEDGIDEIDLIRSGLRRHDDRWISGSKKRILKNEKT